MIKLRKSKDRGLAEHGWLKSRHTFSFADFYDPAQMGFSVLRVINEDQIEGGTGFGTHGHRDMEIISYVIEGALEHKDSMGTQAIIKPGELQRMSAGTGVRHSEHNHAMDKKTHFLQIWIMPDQQGVTPSYDQKSFEKELSSNNLVLVGSKSGRNGSVTIHQDVDMYACKSTADGQHNFKSKSNRNFWLQVIEGSVQLDTETLYPGDGASVESVDSFSLKWSKNSEFLLFDLP
jgi:redox-sensitive bicupin YhaK (pirin superfamily)